MLNQVVNFRHVLPFPLSTPLPWPLTFFQVTQLNKQDQDSIPELALTLQELAAILQHELSGHTSHREIERLLKSDSHAKACLAHLDTLNSIMVLAPREVAVQYSSQPQVRVFVTGLLSRHDMGLLLA